MKFQNPSIHCSKVSNFTEKWKNPSKFQNSVFLFVCLPVSFFLLFISISRVFIIIHEIGNQIIIISYLREIVHCHSIQLILFQHPEFVTSSGT